MKQLEWNDPTSGGVMYKRVNDDGTTSILLSSEDADENGSELLRLPKGITVAAPIDDKVLAAPNVAIELYDPAGEYLYTEAGVKSFIYTGKKYRICAVGGSE